MEATETYSNQPVGVSEWSKCPSEVNLAYFRGTQWVNLVRQSGNTQYWENSPVLEKWKILVLGESPSTQGKGDALQGQEAEDAGLKTGLKKEQHKAWDWIWEWQLVHSFWQLCLLSW